MYNREFSIIECNQISLNATSSFKVKDISHSSNNMMFLEDVGNQILPYISSRSGKKIEFELHPIDENEIDRINVLFFNLSGYGYSRPIDFFPDLFKKITYSLVSRGRITFEIANTKVQYTKKESKRSPHNKNNIFTTQCLIPINGLILNYPTSLIQIIPYQKNIQSKKIWTTVPNSSVWFLKIPDQLGGRWSSKSIQRKLFHSSKLKPDFITEYGNEVINNINITDFYKQRMILQLNATKKWGWDGGISFMNDRQVTEFYLFYKQLIFNRSLAILREYLQSEINNLLTRLNYSSRLIIKGLPSVGEIQEKIDLYNNGQFSFDEILEFFKY